MKPPSPRSRSALAQRAIDLAITGGQHQIVIDSAGRTMILPLSADLKQAEDAALDAAILEVTTKGHGVGRS
jgi:hypothetical protein